ncbi:hypothetical protein [Xylella fastidiosa]|uniref:hypothetical protein n=2 Tax=Xylella fastidiosa TaxID=2371 RepID=UPI0012D9D367|nr:hypothetical protein [Xylella fastidiosa]
MPSIRDIAMNAVTKAPTLVGNGCYESDLSVASKACRNNCRIPASDPQAARFTKINDVNGVYIINTIKAAHDPWWSFGFQAASCRHCSKRLAVSGCETSLIPLPLCAV